MTTAVLAGLTGVAGMASVANAVNVNPDGLGQVLLYPYYSARGGNDTLISIVNTTDDAKAVKVRFIEALNSREVLDFNLYLSPFDVWTAGITADGDGAKMVTRDTSCTVPYFQGGTPGDVGEQEFLNFQYAAQTSADDRFDGGPSGLERTQSGYVEMIEMGTINATSDTFADVKHVDGVPGGDPATACDLVQEQWVPDEGVWDATDEFTDMRSDGVRIPASGGLFGAGSIINVADGTMFSYNATAIDGFWTDAADHTDPGNLDPNLGGGTSSEAFVFSGGNLETLDYTGIDTISAVNAVLSLETLMNEYAIEPDVGGRTEWVLTFPTKRFHTDAAPGGFLGATDEADPPFTETWTRVNGVADPACETQDFDVWNREEGEPIDEPDDIIVSPKPPATERPTFDLCREANVIRFANDGSLPASTEILKEPSREDTFPDLGYVNFDLPEAFLNGWVRFDFGDFQAEADNNGMIVEGLPVIGFQASTSTFGALPTGDGDTVLSNYGGSFNHHGSRSIVASD
ncbi:hypothetical protein DZK26_12320 [Wenzhouxiangella sp. 15190]|nr:hypothetical protein DZK26_12320 [Wenzhouxiangella sp. 15190]